MSQTEQPTTASVAPRGNRRRARLLALLILVVLAGVVAYALYYFLVARFHEDTDDAYVNGDIIQITPQMTGTVIAVNVDDTQAVRAGQPLVELDHADAQVALEQAEANLAQAVRQVRTIFVNNNAYAATVAERQSDVERAASDLQRRQKIAQTGAVSTEEIAHARDALASARAALTAARQQLASNQALTERTSVAQHPSVKQAAAKVRDAYLNVARTTLPAPIDGYVAKRAVQVGQRVSPGAPLMAVVPLNEVWVDANFKEVQLRHMRIGQPVELSADVYGSGVVYHGRVAGFSAGTGSAFSLLPAQNATGNWIKVVQRLPVRIALDAQELARNPLRVGLSMQVDVDIRDEHGAAMNTVTRTGNKTHVFARYGEQADAEIARIIAENAAQPAH